VRTPKSVLLTVIVATLLSVSLAAPASAATRTVRDERGDAVAHIDIVRARFVHADHYVKATVQFRNLRRDRFAEASLTFVNSEADQRVQYFASAWRGPEGRGTVTWASDGVGEWEVFCPALDVEWSFRDGGRASIRMPLSCVDAGDRGDVYSMRARSSLTHEGRSDQTRAVPVER
jgi:hypothetical protein